MALLSWRRSGPSSRGGGDGNSAKLENGSSSRRSSSLEECLAWFEIKLRGFIMAIYEQLCDLLGTEARRHSDCILYSTASV